MSNSLIGGSQSEPKKTFTHGFFHDGVKSMQFRIKNVEHVRFLPGFDHTITNPEEFKNSFVPYRDKVSGELDEETRTPEFTSWFFIVQGYTFYGKGTKSFLSPYTVEKSSKRKGGVDPINDIRNYVYGTNDQNLIKSMVEQQSQKSSAAAPKPRQFMLSNMLVMTDPQSRACDNQIGILSWSAYQDLKDKLAMRTPRNEPIISADWDEYMFGDITNPAEGLMATIKATLLASNNSIKYAGVQFSEDTKTLQGHTPWPIDTSDSTGLSYLQNRYNISDLDTVTRVWTYDEILSYVISDGMVPYEIIKEACDPHAPNGVPAPTGSSKSASYSLPTASSTEEAVQVSPAIPTSPAMQPVASAPAPAVAPAPAPAAPAPAAVAPAPAAVAPTPAAVAPAPAAEDVAKEEIASTTEEAADDKARYDELYLQYKEDPEEMARGELAEFFNICSKLGLSPTPSK
jgi:hypothetical protein